MASYTAPNDPTYGSQVNTQSPEALYQSLFGNTAPTARATNATHLPTAQAVSAPRTNPQTRGGPTGTQPPTANRSPVPASVPSTSPVARDGSIPPVVQPGPDPHMNSGAGAPPPQSQQKAQAPQSQGQVSTQGHGQTTTPNTALPDLNHWGTFSTQQQQILQQRWNQMSPQQRQAFLALPKDEQLRQIGITLPGWTPVSAQPTPGGGTPAPVPTPGTNGGPLPNVSHTYATRSANTVYQPGQLPQIQLPNVNPQEQQQMDLLSQVLQNPLSMSEQGVAQLKARQAEDALAMQQNLQQQLAQGTASRGTLGGGWQGTQDRRIGDTTREQILSGNRDIDITKMQQDMQDRINAINVANPALQGKYDRGITGQNLLMQRALGQEGLNQAGAASNLASYQSDMDAYFAAQDALAKQRQLTIQQQLGTGALDVDRARLAESGRQFNLGNVLDWAQLRSNDDLGRLGVGFDYAQLGQNTQNQTIQQLLGL